MQRWEYLILTRDGRGGVDLEGGTVAGKTSLNSEDALTMGDVLNLAGGEGWECFAHVGETTFAYPSWHFKRPLAVVSDTQENQNDG